MTNFFLGLAFIVSVVALPWWASVLLAVVFLGVGGNPIVVILGGGLLDLLFGAPGLFGISHLYVLYFGILAILASYLRIMLLA